MLTRGSYGIEYDDGTRDNAYQRYWWVFLLIPVILGFLFLRGCSGGNETSDSDPLQAKRFDAPEEKTPVKRLSIWAHFVNYYIKSNAGDTNVTPASTTSSAGSLVKQIDPAVRDLLDKANLAEQGNNLLEARLLLLKLLHMDAASELRPFIERKLGIIHTVIYLSTRPAPGKTTHKLAAGEKIGKLASQYGCSLEYLLFVNSIQRPESLQIGKTLTTLQNPAFELLISKKGGTAVLLFNRGFFKRYTLLLSEGTPPPKGLYRVKSRGKKTLGEDEKSTTISDDKPRFERDICWVTLMTEEGAMQGGIALQGTRNAQTKLALNIRFRNTDIEELYLLLPANTPVIIAD